MKRKRSFKAGLKLQIIFSTFKVIKKSRNIFEKQEYFDVFYNKKEYHIATIEKEEDTVKSGIYMLFTMLTSGHFLIIHPEKTCLV